MWIETHTLLPQESRDGSSVLSLQTLSRHECAACDVNGLEAPIWKQIK